MSETKYERYFGTIDKAAAYLAWRVRCDDCELVGKCYNGSVGCRDAIKAWLESESE